MDEPIKPLHHTADSHLILGRARVEVLLPLQFNDGRDVPAEWLVEA